VPLRDALEQVAAQAVKLSAKLARTIIRAMRNVVEIMHSSFLFFACVRYLARNLLLGPKTAAIVRSIPVRVNVRQLQLPSENIVGCGLLSQHRRYGTDHLECQLPNGR
jgi:hypothetical protein